MLYLTFRKTQISGTRNVTFEKVTEKVISCHFNTVPYAQSENSEIVNVYNLVEIQADGDELEYINNHIKGIPIRVGGVRVITWFGDTAKFIYQNLLTPNWEKIETP